ncbi:hypothetical protein D1007_06131 [Hordeum vulgare]|nr:hypothetical protein D1007_06131 [Hordeum vulgare]
MCSGTKAYEDKKINERTSSISVQKIYCSGLLQNPDSSGSDTEIEDGNEAIDMELSTFVEHVAQGLKMLALSRNNTPMIQESEVTVLNKNKKKNNKWGHVVSQRPSTRMQKRQNIMEKVAAYKMKKNLEVPTT